MMIYQGWCMVGVVVMTTGSRQMRPVAPPVRLQTVILTVIATQTVRRSSAQSHVFEHPTGYRLGEADCCVRILWAGDMSDDMEDEAVSAQHRARLVLAARALLGESRGHNRKPKGFTWEGHVKDMNESEFKLRYRVGSEAFYKLLATLEPELKVKHARLALNSRGGQPIELATRLAAPTSHKQRVPERSWGLF